MLALELPPRLDKIVSLIPPGAVVADIGTDHALLPIFLVRSGRCPRAIASEANLGPFRRAQERIRLEGLQDRVDLRRGYGLEVVEPGEVDVVVIAGVGGTTITSVLTAAPPAVCRGLSRLIIQPMVGTPVVREWLTRNYYEIVAEELAEEDEHLYEIVAGVPVTGYDSLEVSGPAALPDDDVLGPDLLLEVGPRLWADRHPLLKRHIEQKMDRYRAILGHMGHRRSDGGEGMGRDFRTRLAALQRAWEVLEAEKNGPAPMSHLLTDRDGGGR